MKIFKVLLLLIIAVSMSTCATKLNFPISTVVPAADIAAKIEKKNNNYIVEVLATSLASPEQIGRAHV